jgi:hypothetical protein
MDKVQAQTYMRAHATVWDRHNETAHYSENRNPDMSCRIPRTEVAYVGITKAWRFGLFAALVEITDKKEAAGMR